MSAPPKRHVAFDWIDAAGLVLALFVVVLVHVLFVGGPAGWPTRAGAMVSVVAVHRLRRVLFGAPLKFVDRRVSALGLVATALIIFGSLLGVGGLALAAFWKPTAPSAPVERVARRPMEILQVCVVEGQRKSGDACLTPEQRQESEARELGRQEADAAERTREAETRSARHASRIQTFLAIAAAGLAMLVVGGLLDSRRPRQPT